jgi:hypothetical protein
MEGEGKDLSLDEVGLEPKKHQVTASGVEDERLSGRNDKTFRIWLHLALPGDETRAIHLDLYRDRRTPAQEAIISIAVVTNREGDRDRVRDLEDACRRQRGGERRPM